MLRDESTTDSELDEVDEPPEERWLRCASCGAAVTRPEARIADASGLGIQGGAFVNRHGYLHDLEPFLQATGARRFGLSHRADSWFAGYTWTMAYCRGCGAHLGWCFDAIEECSPARFWGLRTASLSG